jgi:BlaI family penicillinase repressor
MSVKVGLTDAEWQIIQLLWEHAPLTISQIEKTLKDKTGWSKHTVISLLKRMMSKGTVRAEDDGRVKLFWPVPGKEDVYAEETQSFLKRLYNGKIGLMLSAMVDKEDLADSEIDELMEILQKSKGGGGHG